MSSYSSIKARCLKEGSLFTDEDFPATASSVYYSKTDPTITWKRPKDLCSDPKFIVGDASRHDLDQGWMGNCWFIAATATLTTRPELLARVVPMEQTFEKDYAGIFRFNLWRFGKWIEVYVDDQLPTVDGQLCFCSNKESPNEFWSALLEKAYAKLHLSYEALQAGQSYEAMVDYTGGVGEAWDITGTDVADFFKRLKVALKKMNSLVCAAIEGDPGTVREARRENGLYAGHAYSIINVAEVEQGNNLVQLILVRNPHGKSEWNGAWSDMSPEWKSLSAEHREKYQLDVKDDGEFWISAEDFLQNFTGIRFCHLDTVAEVAVNKKKAKKQWVVKQYHGEWVKGISAGGCSMNTGDTHNINPKYYIRVVDADDQDSQGTMIVSLTQKYARIKKTLLKKELTEHYIGFVVYKYLGETPQDLNGFRGDPDLLNWEKKTAEGTQWIDRRDVSHRFYLDPGVYCVEVSTFYPDVEGQYLLRIASEQPLESGEMDTSSEPTMPTPSKGGGKFHQLFYKHAGEDEQMDFRELRQMLNNGLKEEEDEEFSKDTCRALIASVGGYSLELEECRQVWRKVKELLVTFHDFDKDATGTLDASELRQAFCNIGFQFSKMTLGKIVKQYCGRKRTLSADDFVLVAVKTKTLYERYQSLPTEWKNMWSLEEWLRIVL